MSQLPYRSKEDLPIGYQQLLDEEELGVFERPINLFRAVANNPEILRSYMLWGQTIWSECGLSERGREIVILTVASTLKCKYEWNQHVKRALNAGLTPDEIAEIATGNLTVFDHRDTLLINFARDTISQEDSGTDVTNRLFEHFDERTIVGIAVLVSHYVSTAYLTETLNIELDEEFIGWDPSEW